MQLKQQFIYSDYLAAKGVLKSKFKKKLRNNFAFLSCVVSEDFFVLVKNGMKDASKMLSVNSVFTGTSGTNPDILTKLIYDSIEIGYNGLAINLFAPKVFRNAIYYAIDKNVPVVSFNMDENNNGKNKRYSTISQNFFKAGETLGSKAEDFLKESGKILITRHSKDINALNLRRDGILSGLRKKLRNLEIHELITGNIIKDATKILATFLKNNPEINLILCTGLADTEAAGLTAKEVGLNYKVLGFDTSKHIFELILEGYIAYTIDQQAYAQGFYPVVQLFLKSTYEIIPNSIDVGRELLGIEEIKKILKPEYKGIKY